MSEENYITSSEWIVKRSILTAGGQSTSFIRARQEKDHPHIAFSRDSGR